MDYKALINQAGQGDTETFAGLVDQFKNMAFGYAYWFCGDFHLAEDIVWSSRLWTACDRKVSGGLS